MWFSLPVDTSGSVHQVAEFCSLVFCLENCTNTHFITFGAKGHVTENRRGGIDKLHKPKRIHHVRKGRGIDAGAQERGLGDATECVND